MGWCMDGGGRAVGRFYHPGYRLIQVIPSCHCI